ncbi:7397_t:CDS:2 [Ambispora gerdemannii]|uniref:7397_t:CDS:1 n=1 Tax=Ambispora gerdemannii TaxID=144530 RepID=A0A9N8V0N1_9GLOM|nr:7397_t:CDS:2 [Ambispora gerdemannii]
MGVMQSSVNEIKNSHYLINVKEESEIERLQVEHHMLRETWRGNFSSPVAQKLESGAEVLDVGCGPGTWLFDVASDYPESNFTGYDTIQAYPSFKPFNVEFCHGDLTLEMPFYKSGRTFDYVHVNSAFFLLSVGKFDINELVRVVKPGGWLEICAIDPFIYDTGPIANQTLYNFHEKMRKAQVDLSFVDNLATILDNTGQLQSIQHDYRCVSLNRTESQIARAAAEIEFRWLVTFSVEYLNTPKADFEKNVEILCAEAESHNSYVKLHRFFCQKILV